MKPITVHIHDAHPGQLLLCGIPFAAGALRSPAGLQLRLRSRALPLWWQTRAHWPDGSIRWVFLHARLDLPEPTAAGPDLAPDLGPDLGDGPLALQLHVTDSDVPDTVCLDGKQLHLGDMHFSLDAAGDWAVGLHGATWQRGRRYLRSAPDLHGPGIDRGAMAPPELQLLEDSPLAPLIRVRSRAEDGISYDELIRLDPHAGTLHWQQRISWCGEEAIHLQHASTRWTLADRSAWQWAGVEGLTPEHTLCVRRPGQMQIDAEPEQPGFPTPVLRRGPQQLVLDKAWQRAPFALRVDRESVHVDTFPAQADALRLLPGTSLRHSIRLGLAPDAILTPARWSLDPEQVCATGAFGPLMARSPVTQRQFPGYEDAIDACLHAGRLSRLDKERGQDTGPPVALTDEIAQDEEYFGLRHYGDWPMKLGAYGGERRMYADNEYDTPYAYWLQFLRTGTLDYVDIAYHSAVHMADLDCKANDGDMRFHGYRDTADDHDQHRVSHGDFGHYWTDGLVLNWLLADDWWAWEAATALAHHITRRFAGAGDDPIRRAFLGCERAVGWPLVALAGVVEVSDDAVLRAKMTQMVAYLARFTSDPDRELEDVQTDGSGDPIRWWRICQQDGTKPFMLGVVMEGLERHHRHCGDPAAAQALIEISRFLVDVMWVDEIEAFIYEWNAFNRGHREEVYPHYINLMVAPGLAYAYELTGERVFRDIARRSFHAALWTLFAPGGGKEIGMVGRTSALMVTRLHQWRSRDQAAYAQRLLPSHGVGFIFTGQPDELGTDVRLLPRSVPALSVAAGAYTARPAAGEQVASGAHLDGSGIYDFREPASTDRGHIELAITPHWDCPPHPGPVDQRAYLHLSDRPFTASCVSLISFYTGLHVRFHDANRHYIEVLEASIEHWRAGEPHHVAIDWDVDAGEATLSMDGERADVRPLTRRLSGAFARLHVGHRPGHWSAEADMSDLRIELG
ncbi:MAG: hypothetical protein HN712_06965 [Gemmatimonadetes bacterium]|nr:hypothetical protein [Gemmatimonadota bacterium]MBT6145817.1 hypothetical protein [Gemmatimonadota bacterium]MBT7860035.1 hypothetical protein [Gemmatimonadota bacterium]